ncbi:RluA family pseudouridine synthase [Ereboglobus luteus]|uniref:RNA pseudouridine synthase n=1 Tax=Ereboglobus luteus TaxID=1796921 RepID=A0A2U8DZF4_9BACT|nr:RluA family pseudouridine synthase [Ereboglobus luteus]AWI07951.1 RNA pseudouridine synthase [Ereboglobus luteus]
MSSQHTYTIAPGVRSIRADKALAIGFPEHSRSALQRAFDAGLVLRGGVALTRDSAVSGGDEIVFSMPQTRPSELRPVEIPLDVLYEDKHLLAINKAAGMVVHPGAATGEDTLVHALLAHCKGSLSGIGGVERPGIVHRLDRETSGVMVIAKTDAAHRGLAEQFSARSLQKEYLALVNGAPSLLSGSITKAIGRHPSQRHKMMAFEDSARSLAPEEKVAEFYDLEADEDENTSVVAGGGRRKSGPRDAHTDWEVVERYGKIAALVRCAIHTGRTHQIRVHMKSLGHILLGDAVYGWKRDARIPEKSQPKRVMLHAEHLVVTHPITGKTLDLRAPVPRDFSSMIKALKTAAKNATETA